MLNEWTDRMEPRDAIEVWRRKVEEDSARRIDMIERDLRRAMHRGRALPIGFVEAMRHFLSLRAKLFPNLPADPALKILVVLAETPGDSDKASVTGIAHGADVPLTTALRYLAIMEVDGIIERIADPADARRTMIRLTDEGRARLHALAEHWTTQLAMVALIPIAAMLLFAHRAWAG